MVGACIRITVTSRYEKISGIKKALRETQNLRAGCSKAAQLLDVAKRALSRKVNGNGKVILDTHPESDQHQN